MRCLIADNTAPLRFVSGGEMLLVDHFTHARRRLDTHVLIVCVEGVLHIAQDGRRYTLRENDYITLFAGHEHYGYMECEEPVTYYWCHFTACGETNGAVVDTGALDAPREGGGEETVGSACYVLPEAGKISKSSRVCLLFRQLLDISRDAYSPRFCDYALSTLAMEIFQEFLRSGERSKVNSRLEQVIEWLRVNYNKDLDLAAIAGRFGYNGDYLSTSFKQYKGMPLMKYITSIRIAEAKKLLVNTQAGVKEIAYTVGFGDEKNFFKRFKQYEGLSPAQYRTAFTKAKLVTGKA
jgi:AraC-like DNA-binding protein